LIVCDKCGKKLSVAPLPYGWKVERTGVKVEHFCDDCSGIPFPPDWPYKAKVTVERKGKAKTREEADEAGTQRGLFDSAAGKSGKGSAKR
jgi:hypothetical protein